MQQVFRIVSLTKQLRLSAVLFACIILAQHIGFSQSITNEGNDFWFGFTEPVDGQSTVAIPQDTSIVFQANISSRFNTTGLIIGTRIPEIIVTIFT